MAMPSVVKDRAGVGGFRKELGWFSLLTMSLGTVIGSGWLLASMYAAQAAGPAALLAWVIAGILMLLVALVFAELGIAKPESGGLVRYPLYSNGRLAAAIRILPRRIFGERMDRAHVGQTEMINQGVAIGERFLEQPAGIEKDDRDRRIDICGEFQQRRRFRAERRHQCELLASDHLNSGANDVRRRSLV